MSVLHVIDETVLVSKMSAALARLSDEALSRAWSRAITYPDLPEFKALGSSDYRALDLAACKAEMIRRALRVGKGFGQRKEAA